MSSATQESAVSFWKTLQVEVAKLIPDDMDVTGLPLEHILQMLSFKLLQQIQVDLEALLQAHQQTQAEVEVLRQAYQQTQAELKALRQFIQSREEMLEKELKTITALLQQLLAQK